MNNKEFHLSLNSIPNNFLHTIRLGNGLWHRFGDINAATGGTLPTGSANGFGCAGIGDQLHMCASCNGPAGGGVFHSLRYGNGSWTPFSQLPVGLGKPVCVGVGEDLHVVVVSGKPFHSIRFPDGSWTAFGDIFHETGNPGPVFEAHGYCAVASVSGSLHVLFLSLTNNLWHTQRKKDGTWYPIKNITAAIGFPNGIGNVSCVGINGELHIICGSFGLGYPAGLRGDIWHVSGHLEVVLNEYGYFGGKMVWSAPQDIKSVAGDHGVVYSFAATEVREELHVITASSMGSPDLWHTVRHKDGTWSSFGNVEYAVTGNSGLLTFGLMACAGVEPGTYQPPSGTGTQMPPEGGEESQGGEEVMCYPGVPGASEVIVSNSSGSTQSIWSLDLVTGVPTLVDEIEDGETTNFNLINCHYIRFIAVDHSWVTDYNQRFGYNFDVHSWDTAQTINFQKYVALILGRTNGGPAVISIT